MDQKYISEVIIVVKTRKLLDDTEHSLQRYMKEIASSQPLSAEEERSLASRIKKGDLEARDKLIKANLRFVITVARKYQNQEIPLADLISAGNLGLITAAERFDATKGVKFISYAVWWIRQAIQQSLKEDSRIVRLPVNRLDLLQRIFRYIKSQQKETSYYPTVEEIAKELAEAGADIVTEEISAELAAQLEAGKDVAYTALATSEGVAVAGVTSDKESSEGAAVVLERDEAAGVEYVLTEDGVLVHSVDLTETGITETMAAAVVDADKNSDGS